MPRMFEGEEHNCDKCHVKGCCSIESMVKYVRNLSNEENEEFSRKVSLLDDGLGTVLTKETANHFLDGQSPLEVIRTCISIAFGLGIIAEKGVDVSVKPENGIAS